MKRPPSRSHYGVPRIRTHPFRSDNHAEDYVRGFAQLPCNEYLRVAALPCIAAAGEIEVSQTWPSVVIKTLRYPTFKLEGELWGFAPVQALGTINGREFYFRARHNDWTFEIADSATSALPSDGGRSGFVRSGAFSNASFMSHDVAESLIVTCVEQFLGEERARDG
jgi:hypothetical protein